MSQQSNPATLREALTALLEWKPVDGSADALTWRTKLRPLVVAALAASDTEAAPEPDTSDIPEIKDWSKAVVGKFYRPKPAQAAASPEGEGRTMNDLGPCGKHPRKIAETPAQAWHRAYESPNADKDPSQHCPECDREAALRQSAAPSGGAIWCDSCGQDVTGESYRPHRYVICHKPGCADRYVKHSRNLDRRIDSPTFAPESKTGAVTETK